MRLSELAARVGARLENCPRPEELEITGIAPIEAAGAGQIAYVGSARDCAAARSTGASAVILSSGSVPFPVPMLRGDVPYLIVARVLDLFHAPLRYEPGVHPTAVIHDSAKIGPRVSIGAYVVIDQDVERGCCGAPCTRRELSRCARRGPVL